MHVCLDLVVEYIYCPFVGTLGCHSYFKPYYLCHLASLFQPLPSLTPPMCPSHSLPYIQWPILTNSIKNCQKQMKISHCLSTCQVSCTKADNQVRISVNRSNTNSRLVILNWVFKIVFLEILASAN